jgi:CubicO group peptidase (beta-lactamase class C family)
MLEGGKANIRRARQLLEWLKPLVLVRRMHVQISETRSGQDAKATISYFLHHFATDAKSVDENSSPSDFFAAYGTLQLDPTSAPVSSDTVMWLASCSKVVTSIAALQCIECGLFTLDDAADVDRLLPEWKDPDVLTGFTDDGKPILQPAKEKITLRQLLSHTSGIAYDFMHPSLTQWRQSRGEGPLGMRAPITKGFLHPLVFEPGSSWMYGGGLDLVGLMVARANNTTLEAYMRQNIFDVLGMDDTTFHLKEHENLIARLMPMTSRAASGELVDGQGQNVGIPVPLEPVNDFGGAGLFGTAVDFLKLLKSILHNDGRLLKSQSIDTLFLPCLSEGQRGALNFMQSVPEVAAIMIPGEPLFGTPGAGDWTHSIGGLVGLHDSDDGFQPGWLRWGGAPNLTWWIDRKGGTCGIFATQLYPPGELKYAFLGKMFQKEMVAHFAKAEV